MRVEARECEIGRLRECEPRALREARCGGAERAVEIEARSAGSPRRLLADRNAGRRRAGVRMRCTSERREQHGQREERGAEPTELLQESHPRAKEADTRWRVNAPSRPVARHAASEHARAGPLAPFARSADDPSRMHAHAHHDHAHHDHTHGAGSAREVRARGRADSRRRLTAALALVAVYLVAEAIAGYLTGSLALLADAGHMLADAGSLALALFAMWLAARPAPAAHTFGYQRAEILAALANGVALVVVAILIGIEAAQRFSAPPAVNGAAVLVVAAGGLAVNLAGMALLHGARDAGLNMRGAWLHVISDALGSVAAIASGAAIWLAQLRIADPLASLAIGVLVLRSAWALLRETVDVLLEAAPSHLDVDALRSALAAQPGVVSVHDLHVWTITSGLISLSCHVHGAADADAHELLGRLTHELRERFGIYHATIQLEPEGFSEREAVC